MNMAPPQTPHTEAPTKLKSENKSVVEPSPRPPRPAVASTFRMGMDCLHMTLSKDNHDWIYEIATGDYDIIRNMWTVMRSPDEMDTEEGPLTPNDPPTSLSMAHTCEWLTTEVDHYRQLNSQMKEAKLCMVKKLENLQAELELARSHSAKNIPLPTPPSTTPVPRSIYASAVSTSANNKTRTVNPKSTAERGHCQHLIVRPFPHVPIELHAEPDVIMDKLNDLLEKAEGADSIKVIGAKWNRSGNLILISDVNHTGTDLQKHQQTIDEALHTEPLKEVRLIIHTDAK
jgi:hypothetical protein